MRTTPGQRQRKIKIHILVLLLDTEHDDTHRSPTHTHAHTHTHTHTKHAETAPVNSFTEISLLWQQVSHQQQLTFGPWNWEKKHSNGRCVDDVQSVDRGIQVIYLWFYTDFLGGGGAGVEISVSKRSTIISQAFRLLLPLHFCATSPSRALSRYWRWAVSIT